MSPKLDEKFCLSSWYARALKSNWRGHCHQTYGGLEWLQLFLAVGSTPPKLVEIVNRHISSVIREDASRVASCELQPAATVREGANRHEARAPHKISDGKKLRKEAKELQSKMQAEEKRWRDGVSRMSKKSWCALVNEVDFAWKIAIDVSNANGHPYKNREGALVSPQKDRKPLVEAVLQEWRSDIASQ